MRHQLLLHRGEQLRRFEVSCWTVLVNRHSILPLRNVVSLQRGLFDNLCRLWEAGGPESFQPGACSMQSLQCRLLLQRHMPESALERAPAAMRDTTESHPSGGEHLCARYPVDKSRSTDGYGSSRGSNLRGCVASAASCQFRRCR